MSPMTTGQIRSFLNQGSRTAKVATVRADGRPHVVPVWFVLDGDDLVFTTGAETVKARALRRTGRAALCVDLERSPFAYVMVEGRSRSPTISTRCSGGRRGSRRATRARSERRSSDGETRSRASSSFASGRLASSPSPTSTAEPAPGGAARGRRGAHLGFAARAAAQGQRPDLAV